MGGLVRQRMRLAGGGGLAYATAGDPSSPALLLIHGFPSSASTFRDVIPELSRVAFVVAPDLPGSGASDVPSEATFHEFAVAVGELLERLGVGPRYVYLHDFGAPVGLSLAMQVPDDVLGLIVQNGNAHATGFDGSWASTLEFWADPSPENERAATTHLTAEGVRAQYVGGLPPDVAARIPAAVWEEDWRVMQLPGRMATQRAILRDYGAHVARFGEIADYLRDRQPPALLLWGRHDPFFALAEVWSWLEDLPRMEAHILDGGHFLLETHATEAAALMARFVARGGGQGQLEGDVVFSAGGVLEEDAT